MATPRNDYPTPDGTCIRDYIHVEDLVEDKAGIEKFLSALEAYDIEVDPETITVAWSKTLALAESFRLSVYDAAYLELALRRGLPLASLDDSLRTAMQKADGRLLFRSR